MKPKQLVTETFSKHLEVAQQTAAMADEIVRAGLAVADVFRSGNKLLLAGNGGSAADAQHWAAEWIIRLKPAPVRPAMPAIALTTDTSILTAGANDIGYDNVFARQVEGLGVAGDMLLVISTSGNSENLIRAAEMAHGKGMTVLGVLGKGGGPLKEKCDISLVVPSDQTGHIQEMHIIIGHLLCDISESEVYGMDV